MSDSQNDFGAPTANKYTWSGVSVSDVLGGAVGRITAHAPEGPVGSARIRVDDNALDPELAAACGTQVTNLDQLEIDPTHLSVSLFEALRRYIAKESFPDRVTVGVDSLRGVRDAALVGAGWRLDSCVSHAPIPAPGAIDPTVAIVEFSPENTDGVMRLYREYAAYLSSISPFTNFDMQAELHIKSRLRDRGNPSASESLIRVAIDWQTRELVGVVEFSVDPIHGSPSSESVCTIQWIGVTETGRQLGIGRRLVRAAALAHAEIRRVDAAYLTCAGGPAAFWDRLGFKPYWYNFELLGSNNDNR